MNEPIINFVSVGDLFKILEKVEKLGGKIMRPPEEIKTVGLVAIIKDPEGNPIGLGQPE